MSVIYGFQMLLFLVILGSKRLWTSGCVLFVCSNDCGLCVCDLQVSKNDIMQKRTPFFLSEGG